MPLLDIETGLKACPSCGTAKESIEFYSDRSRADKLSAYCKKCANAKDSTRQRRRKIKGPTIERSNTKECTSCNRLLPLEEFYEIKNRPDWLSYYCRDCHSKKNRSRWEDPEFRKKFYAWRKRNKDKVDEYDKKKRANRRNVEVSDLTSEEWNALLENNGGVCAFCGTPEDMTQDHAIPLARGGNHTLTNIIPACRSCNARKQTKTPLEFIVWQMELN